MKSVFDPLTDEETLEVYREIIRWIKSHSGVVSCPKKYAGACSDCPYKTRSGVGCIQIQLGEVADIGMNLSKVLEQDL